MELCGFLKLKLNFLHVFAAAVYDMHVDKDEVPTDPSLSMEACRQFDRLRGVPLGQYNLIHRQKWTRKIYESLFGWKLR